MTVNVIETAVKESVIVGDEQKDCPRPGLDCDEGEENQNETTQSSSGHFLVAESMLAAVVAA